MRRANTNVRQLLITIIGWMMVMALVVSCTSVAPKPTEPPRVEPVPATPPTLQHGQFKSPTPAIHVLLWGQPEPVLERTLGQAREMGFRWVKQRFEWRFIEPREKGSFEWHEPDRLVSAIRSAGLGIIARVDNQPAWANAERIFPVTSPPDRLEDWADYLYALASRYKGQIQAYEIWNEPNIAREWGEKRPDAVRYTELLKVSYEAIKRADPEALVISAGLSPTTERSDRAIPPAEYLTAMYAAGAKDSFDLLGAHAAGFKASPDLDPGEVSRRADLTNNDPSDPALKRVYAFRFIEDLHAIMQQHGDGEKQIAILEMGWTTDIRPSSPYHWHAVTPEQQGEYLVQAFRWATEHWQPWIGPMTTIYLAKPDWTANDEQYWWSITNPDGTTRPAFDALKTHFSTRAE